MYRVAENMVALVGCPPMVRINHIVPNKKVKVYAKLERYNPAGSVKDRIAKYMIEYGERGGLLSKDKIVIEPTSGNTGSALAFVCAAKGYKLVLTMPETMSLERRTLLAMLGAQLVLTPWIFGRALIYRACQVFEINWVAKLLQWLPICNRARTGR